jgi:LMBR1 domain-containing protein 1
LHAAVTIKGCTKVGLSLLLFTVRPMRPGATLMNDFLFNVALVLLATNAAIQFCAQAFALYANESAIHEIWGSQVIQPCPLDNRTS